MYNDRSQCVPFPLCPAFSIENVISTPTDLTTLGFHPYGWTCATFKSYKWCENGAPTSRYSTGYWPMKKLLSPDGYNPLQACVACGGGGNGSHVTTFSASFGLVAQLHTGPGYSRNSSVLLWCYPDESWKSIVVMGQPATSIDRRPRVYLSHMGGFINGQVFVVTMKGGAGPQYPCYGTDVYTYFYQWQDPCAMHIGALARGQQANMMMMWLDPRPNRFVGTKRNGVQSYSYPTYPYAYTFLSANSSTYGSEYADFKTTACAYGYWKEKGGNHACKPWSTYSGCPPGQGFVEGNITHDSACVECSAGYYNMYNDRSQCVPFPLCPAFSIENVISTPTDLTTLGFHPYGWTCATFKSYKWCENGAPTSRYSTGYWPMKKLLSPDGYNPLQACVACGGGGNGSHVTTFSASFGLVAQLHTGPGYSRNSSVLLWCYPDESWKSIVVMGQPATSIDRRPRVYLSHMGGFINGQVFVVTMKGGAGPQYPCYGTDVYTYFYQWQDPCAMHSGALGRGQQANMMMMWLDPRPNRFVGTKRNGVQSYSYPTYPYAYTFLSANSSTYGLEYADFKTTACAYGYWKEKGGNHACKLWSTFGGCPVGKGFLEGNITHDSRCEVCGDGYYNAMNDRSPCLLLPSCSQFTGIENEISTPTDLTTLGFHPYGWTCATFKSYKWCENGAPTSRYSTGYWPMKKLLSPDGYNPLQACVACGGGGNGSHVTTFSAPFGLVAQLHTGPGYSRNSSVLLWCYPDESWRAVVVMGQPATSFDRRYRVYLSHMGGFINGQVFVVTMKGGAGPQYPCYGTDVYTYFYQWQDPCAMHSGALGRGQQANMMMMWLDPRPNRFVGTKRNGIQSYSYPTYPYAYTFLSANSSTYNAAFADFKTTACAYGYWKSKGGNHACIPWSTFGGCPVGQGFVEGNITHDSGCVACGPNGFNMNFDRSSCLSYPECPAHTLLGESPLVAYDLSLTRAFSLECGPGYERNSSVLLWCYPGGDWKSIVVSGTPATSVDTKGVRSYVSQFGGFTLGQVFVVTMKGILNNGYPCYGTGVYVYFYQYMAPCAVHASVLGVSQTADMVMMWVDHRPQKFVASKRNGVQSHNYPAYRYGVAFLSGNSTTHTPEFADFKTTVCPCGTFKATAGNYLCKPWSTLGGCAPGQGFVPGNTTHDASCQQCPAGTYNSNFDLTGCLATPACPPLPAAPGSTVTEYSFQAIGTGVSLDCAPGFARNSSVMLWCYPDRTWRSLVVLGTPAVGVDTYPYARPYLGHFGFKAGNVFRLALTGVVYNGYPCYGTDVYSYFYHWVAPCAVHAGVLGVAQRADVGVMWVDPRPNTFIGTKRYGVLSYSYGATYPYAFTFLSGNSTTYGAGYADFKATPCSYGFFKAKFGNSACVPWSTTQGCPAGRRSVVGNTTRDSSCEVCPPGFTKPFFGLGDCLPAVDSCPPLPPMLGGSVVRSFDTTVGTMKSLVCAPGYTRNSSAVLLCDTVAGEWKSIVVKTASVYQVGDQVAQPFKYGISGAPGFIPGRIFVATLHYVYSWYPCYGTDVYWNYVWLISQCAFHAGVLGRNQVADVTRMWVRHDTLKGPIAGSVRNGVTSYSFNSASAYVFVGTGMAWSASHADFKTTPCPKGYFKATAGNAPCQPWSSTATGGCPPGRSCCRATSHTTPAVCPAKPATTSRSLT